MDWGRSEINPHRTPLHSVDHYPHQYGSRTGNRLDVQLQHAVSAGIGGWLHHLVGRGRILASLCRPDESTQEFGPGQPRHPARHAPWTILDR